MSNFKEHDKKYIKREQRFSVEDLKQLQVVIRRTGEEEGKEFFADLVDISRRGLKFHVPICIGFAEELVVRLESRQMEVEYEGICTARHIRSISEKCWEVGCSLEPHLTEEVIDFVVGVSGRERRANPRISLSHAAELRRQGQVDGVSAQIKNISLGGFCLHIPDEHEVGEKVKLQLEDPDGNEHSIAGRIRWQNKGEDGYLVGCSFVEANSHLILLSCLHESKSEDGLNWFVVAAAIFAMFLPPAVSLLVSSDGQAVQSDVGKNLGDDAAGNSNPAIKTPKTEVVTPPAVETQPDPPQVNQPKPIPEPEPEVETPFEVVETPDQSSPNVEPKVDPVTEPERIENPWVVNPKETVVVEPTPVKPEQTPWEPNPDPDSAVANGPPEQIEVPNILTNGANEPSDAVDQGEASSRPDPTSLPTKDPLDALLEELPEVGPIITVPPKAQTPKVDPSKVDPPKVDPPKVDPPKVDPPKVDPPKVDPPKVDPPKVDPPKVDPPKVDPPKVDPVDPPKSTPEEPEEVEDPDMRVWRHHGGLKTIKGKLEKVDGDEVILRDSNGKKQILPYDWFSISDLIYLGEVGQKNE